MYIINVYKLIDDNICSTRQTATQSIQTDFTIIGRDMILIKKKKKQK